MRMATEGIVCVGKTAQDHKICGNDVPSGRSQPCTVAPLRLEVREVCLGDRNLAPKRL
jgi:hypothetical protein